MSDRVLCETRRDQHSIHSEPLLYRGCLAMWGSVDAGEAGGTSLFRVTIADQRLPGVPAMLLSWETFTLYPYNHSWFNITTINEQD